MAKFKIMEELDEEKIIALGEEYANSRMQFFRPWEGSYHLACKNAFINAYAAGYYDCKRKYEPDFEIPEPVRDIIQMPE